MKFGDIIYYVDKGAKFYFDMQFIEYVPIKEYNTYIIKAKILYNKYKFNNDNYKPNLELKDRIDTFSKLCICTTLEEAEEAIK